ncbi:MAG: hypothetical protein ACM3PY_21485 [Omnitrophica WOR_2 bacterium]
MTGGVIVGAGIYGIVIVATGLGDKLVAGAVFAGIVATGRVEAMLVKGGAGFAILHPDKLNKINRQKHCL